MDQPRPEVIVASTLYLMSSWVFDPSPCPCRLQAIVAHLERMMQMPDLDPVLRATAIQLHAHWRGIEPGRAAEPGPLEDETAPLVFH